MTENDKSAIIGYWRSGATPEEIYEITGFYDHEVRDVISDHIKKTKAFDYISKNKEQIMKWLY